jgi:hypothetical protein
VYISPLVCTSLHSRYSRVCMAGPALAAFLNSIGFKPVAPVPDPRVKRSRDVIRRCKASSKASGRVRSSGVVVHWLLIVCVVTSDSRLEHSSRLVEEAEGRLRGENHIHISTAHKIYSREFEGSRVSKIGDPIFPMAKLTWDRLVQDFPVQEHLLRRLVGLAFKR